MRSACGLRNRSHRGNIATENTEVTEMEVDMGLKVMITDKTVFFLSVFSVNSVASLCG